MPAKPEALEHHHIVRAFDEELARLTSTIVEMGDLPNAKSPMRCGPCSKATSN